MRTRQLSAKIRTDQEKNVKLCHVWSGSDEQLLRETKNGHTRFLWSLVTTLPQTPNTRLHRCCATAPSSVSCSLRLMHNIYGAIISVFTTKMSEYNCNPTDSSWALHPENNNKLQVSGMQTWEPHYVRVSLIIWMFGWMCSLQRLRVFFFIYSLLNTTDLQVGMGIV